MENFRLVKPSSKLVHGFYNELSLSNFSALNTEIWSVKHVEVFQDTWYRDSPGY